MRKYLIKLVVVFLIAGMMLGLEVKAMLTPEPAPEIAILTKPIEAPRLDPEPLPTKKVDKVVAVVEKVIEPEPIKIAPVPSRASESRVKSKPDQDIEAELGLYTITAYDLSVQSCGKELGHPNYGLTASGYNLTGLSRGEAMTIAVDTSVIPMGSKVKLEFRDSNWTHLNGVYTARDRGGAIKGKKIDLFYGDFQQYKPHQSVWDFGVRKATVTVLKP